MPTKRPIIGRDALPLSYSEDGNGEPDPSCETPHEVLLGIVRQQALENATLRRELQEAKEELTQTQRMCEYLKKVIYELLSHIKRDPLLPNLFRHDQAKHELTRLLNALNKKQDQTNDKRHQGCFIASAMIDLDFFKPVNDTFGHIVGDRTLQGVAIFIEHGFNIVAREFLRREFDCYDPIRARQGGEEFWMAFPCGKPDDAIHIVTNIRKKLEKARFIKVGQNGFYFYLDPNTIYQWVETPMPSNQAKTKLGSSLLAKNPGCFVCINKNDFPDSLTAFFAEIEREGALNSALRKGKPTMKEQYVLDGKGRIFLDCGTNAWGFGRAYQLEGKRFKQISRQMLPDKGSNDVTRIYQITCSIGLTVRSLKNILGMPEEERFTILKEFADRALYAAKAGRNKVCFEDQNNDIYHVDSSGNHHPVAQRSAQPCSWLRHAARLLVRRFE